MEEATKATELAKFDNQELEHGGPVSSRQDPQSTAYLLGLANSYEHVKQNETAKRYNQQLLESKPNYPAYLRLKEQANAQN